MTRSSGQKALDSRQVLDSRQALRTANVITETTAYGAQLIQELRRLSTSRIGTTAGSKSAAELEQWYRSSQLLRSSGGSRRRRTGFRPSDANSRPLPSPEAPAPVSAFPEEEEEEPLPESFQSRDVDIADLEPFGEEEAAASESPDLPRAEERPPIDSDLPPENAELPADAADLPPPEDVPPIDSDLPPENAERPPENAELPPAEEWPPIDSDLPPENAELPLLEEVLVDDFDSPAEEILPVAADLPPVNPELPANPLVLAVDAAEAERETGAGSVEAIPVRYYAGVRARGFAVLLFTGFPAEGNLALVRLTAREGGVAVLACPPIDEGASAAVGGDHRYDPAATRLLRAGDWRQFVAMLEGGGFADGGVAHFSTEPYALSVGLLLLPGMRVLRGGDSQRNDLLRRVLERPALQEGAFSIPEFTRTFGEMAVWKYAADTERVIVCFNFVNAHAVADVKCPDVPDALDGDKIDLLEILSDTTYRRIPEQLRTNGLHVILHEFEIQVFSY